MRARKVDGNQSALRDDWRSIGGGWLSIYPEQGGEPDALVSWQGMDQLVEVKLPPGKKGGTSHSELTDDQIQWHSKWPGRPVATVRTFRDLLILFGVDYEIRVIP